MSVGCRLHKCFANRNRASARQMIFMDERGEAMETYRIANFILQLGYLLVHILFTVKILRIRRNTPVWTWFFLFSVSMWLWVSGRFAESIVYMFLSDNNTAYVFAANYQYIGITMAASTYLIWNLYLAGHDRLAKNKLLQSVIYIYPFAVCIIVFTNNFHHLFYTKLEMWQRVAHGPLFMPAMLTGYLLMLAGYLISMTDIIRKREQIARKLLLFSTFPFLPAIAIAVRTISGVDRFDYTPIVMGIVYLCLYLVVFRYNDAGIVPASMMAVVEQAMHPITIYDPVRKEFTYKNRIAREQYSDKLGAIVESLPNEAAFEKDFLRVAVTCLPESGEVLVAATDLTDITRQIIELQNTISELERVSLELDEENRNIDAYLDTLYHTEGLEHKKVIIDQIYKQIADVFTVLKHNLKAAKEMPENAEVPLQDNIQAAEACMVNIRAAVARLREV